MRNFWKRLLILLVACIAAVSAVAKQIDNVRWEAITNVASLTRQKRLTEACGWTMTWRAKGGSTVEVNYNEGQGTKHIEFWAVPASGKKVSGGTLTITNGIWYAKTPGRKPGKFRPYEAPLFHGSFYNLLQFCELRFVDEQSIRREDVELVAITNGVIELAIKSGPALDPVLSSVRQLLARVIKMGDFKARAETEDRLRRILAEGWRIKVDEDTGILMESETAAAHFAFSKFRWSKSPAASIDGEWLDRTSMIKGMGTDGLIMAFYRSPGLEKSNDLDGYLLDLRSKEYRRIPARVASAPGCFLPGRTKTLVHISDADTGGIRPVVVNLKTGENSAFGPSELHQAMGITIGGSVSPDGKTVALVFLPDLGAMDKKRICAIDIGSNKLRVIGPEGDYTDVLWLGNGGDLVVERIITDEKDRGDSPIRHEIGIMDNEGKYRPIALGKRPLVLSENRIVFFSAAKKRYVTADRNGRRERLLSTKLDSDYGSPAVSPDRKNLIIMKFAADQSIIPFGLELQTDEMFEMKWPVGAWAAPVWAR